MKLNKFRIWDKRNKEFRYPPALGEWDFEDCNIFMEYQIDNTIQQYTSFKDKDDNEIYEGDIIQYIDKFNNLVVAGVPVLTNFQWFADLEYCFKKDIKIIGDIYQSFELLQR